MARPVIEGLDYISIDVDIFDDLKILFVSERFAEKGELITIKLLLWIYKNGYYVRWDDEIALLFAKRNFKNVSFDLVNDVVGELLKRGFFAEDIFKQFGILTSRGIQKRWLSIITDAKRKCKIKDEYNLLIPQIKEETPAKTEETPSKLELMQSEREETTQRKGKKRKGKERMVSESDDDPRVPEIFKLLRFASTGYEDDFLLWQARVFLTKYPSTIARQSGMLVNSWIARITQKDVETFNRMKNRKDEPELSKIFITASNPELNEW